jgi:hypothetical protein
MNLHYSLRSDPEECSSHPLHGGSLKITHFLSLVRSSFGPTTSERRKTVADVGYKKEVLGPQLLKVGGGERETDRQTADVGCKKEVLGPQLLKVGGERERDRQTDS